MSGGRAAPSASFPCGTALGATWNPELVRTVGRADRWRGAPQGCARAARADRQHPPASARGPQLRVLLRRSVPLGADGRAVHQRRAVDGRRLLGEALRRQRLRVRAQTISSEVDERTLREISLVPFEAAVLEADTWSVMAAYNRLHGTYCSEHPLLDRACSKREWSFDGVIMSDWYGTHSTVPAANAGLDLEMPGPAQFFGREPRRGSARGRRRREDPRRQGAARARSCSSAAGGLDTPDFGPELSIDDPEDRAVVRRAAAESFVLLRQSTSCALADRARRRRGRRRRRCSR